MVQEFTFPALEARQKKKMLKSALTVLEMTQAMSAGKGKNILHYTLQRKRRHKAMEHYPGGDRIEYSTGAQYFYHCHREDRETGEHGHFHSFMRYKKIPRRIRPAALPDWDKNLDNPMAHIVAIAMDCYGKPIRLFTVNRWVTDETWYDAEHVTEFIRKYKFRQDKEEESYWWKLDKWVESMHQLFAPQIIWLHQERDHRVAAWQKKYPSRNPYEDRELEEITSIPIDIVDQVNWLMR